MSKIHLICWVQCDFQRKMFYYNRTICQLCQFIFLVSWREFRVKLMSVSSLYNDGCYTRNRICCFLIKKNIRSPSYICPLPLHLMADCSLKFEFNICFPLSNMISLFNNKVTRVTSETYSLKLTKSYYNVSISNYRHRSLKMVEEVLMLSIYPL